MNWDPAADDDEEEDADVDADDDDDEDDAPPAVEVRTSERAHTSPPHERDGSYSVVYIGRIGGG